MSKGKQNKHNKNTSQALVVYAKPPPAKAKKKHKKNASGGGDSALANYRAALSSPFALAAQGARVPDMYSCPTVTRHLTRTVTLITNSSGEADLVVLPSGYMHAISFRASVVAGQTWSTLDGANLTGAIVSTPPSNLAAQLTNYRIVGYGIKVFGIASMTTNAGKVCLGTTAMSSWLNTRDAVGNFSSNIANSAATPLNTLLAYGIPSSGAVVDISSMPAMLNSAETSLVNISERPLFVVPKITSPEAFNFRQSKDSSIGFNITDQTSVSNVQTGDASYLRVAGHEAIVLGITGAASNTNVLEVEIMYHLEGTPVSVSSNLSTGDAAVSVVSPVSWMNVVQSVARMPAFRQAVETGGNSVFPGLGTLANRFY